MTVVVKQTAFPVPFFLGAKNSFNRQRGFFLSMPGHFEFRRQRELFSEFCHFCRFIETAPQYSEVKNIAPEIMHHSWIFLRDINTSVISLWLFSFSFSAVSCLINPFTNIFPSSCTCK